MKNEKIALKFANEKGYDNVTFYSKFNKSDVYVAEHKGDIEFIGYPVFILVENDNVHLATIKERILIVNSNN